MPPTSPASATWTGSSRTRRPASASTPCVPSATRSAAVWRSCSARLRGRPTVVSEQALVVRRARPLRPVVAGAGRRDVLPDRVAGRPAASSISPSAQPPVLTTFSLPKSTATSAATSCCAAEAASVERTRPADRRARCRPQPAAQGLRARPRRGCHRRSPSTCCGARARRTSGHGPLYESCGFVREGVLRWEFRRDGFYVDDILMALDLTDSPIERQ